MAKDKEEDLLPEFLKEEDILKEFKDNKISDEDREKFISQLKDNWYLDSDGLNFLDENGISFFSFDNNECFCLSKKKFEECCKPKINNKVDENYVSGYEALKDDKLWKEYLIWSAKLISDLEAEFIKNKNCQYPNCKNKAVKNELYNLAEVDNKVSTVKDNFFDIYSIIGTNLFKDTNINTFRFYGFCEDCDSKLLEIENKPGSKLTDAEKVDVTYRTLIFKFYELGFKHFVYSTEFLKFINSIKLDGYKNLMIYKLKKVTNEYRAILELKDAYLNQMKNDSLQGVKIYEFKVSSGHNFEIKDCFLPQVQPETFKTINSNNNLFIKPRFGVIVLLNEQKGSTCLMVCDKNDTLVIEYLDYWRDKLKNNTVETESFISNNALIVSDNILIDKSVFDKFDDEEKSVISVFNKIRFDSPKEGQDIFIIRMMTGFDRGNNFFK